MTGTAVALLVCTIVGLGVIAVIRGGARTQGRRAEAPSGLRAGRSRGRTETLVNTLMPALVSLALLGGALYVILSKRYSNETSKWAFGTVGTVAGYWFGTRSA
jgi:hypothetical protein